MAYMKLISADWILSIMWRENYKKPELEIGDSNDRSIGGFLFSMSIYPSESGHVVSNGSAL